MIDAVRRELELFARKYIWWKTPEEALKSPAQVVAQVMEHGDYFDVQRLAETVGESCLREVLAHAEPGIFSEKSWIYWHYRLGLAKEPDQVPPLVKRKFASASQPDQSHSIMRLGLLLADERLRRNESSEAFASRLGISRHILAKMEQGDLQVPIEAWVRAFRLIGVDLAKLELMSLGGGDLDETRPPSRSSERNDTAAEKGDFIFASSGLHPDLGEAKKSFGGPEDGPLNAASRPERRFSGDFSTPSEGEIPSVEGTADREVPGGGHVLPLERRSDAARPLILVVDDETFMRKIFRPSLEAAGCRVEEACTGQEALERFQHLRPDLVILDLVMPGMDGFETCAALRSREEGRHTPILAVTGLQDTASLHKAFEAGATDFITKPVSGELLGYRVRYLLRAGRVLEELVRSEANLRLLRAAVESLPIGITISDIEGRILYTNPAEAAMHGFEVGDLLCRETRVLAPQRLHNTRQVEEIEECDAWQRESVNRKKNGEEFPVQLSSVAVRNPQGKFIGIITACEDITERKKNESQIHQLAYFDTLTGLPNRVLFLDRLQKALASADRSQATVAVLFLDLDNFKDINDTQGHDFGDRLLMEVARRLSDCIRGADTLARLGGDEFVVILAAADGQQTASVTAQRILNACRTPFEVEGRRIYAGISIGIALYPNDASSLEGVLRSADTAMYQAKALGRQNFQFFSDRMNKEIVEKVALENALRQALEHGDFTLFYQPQWDLQTGRQCGVEALLRWQHPELGEISPRRFIPLAESSGQIFRLDEWVLRSACSQACAWAGKGGPVERVSVNVSGYQLRQPDFPDLIERILAETKLDPSKLELEFTESVVMEHAENTVGVMQALKGMGIHLSIDDFGTGYSSLSYLKHFPVDRIKIDQVFVGGIDHDASDASIVEAVIALARTLKIKVLAEGVETRAQLEFLQGHGCSEGQGFFLGAPMAARDLLRRMERTPKWGDSEEDAGVSGRENLLA